MPDIFLSSNPAEPWSFYPLGLPAFAIVAAALALLTIWTDLGHPQPAPSDAGDADRETAAV